MSEISLSKAGLSPPPADERENLLASLGPGLITGAADDDPSGIATYLLVGAQFGFAMLWTMLFSFPLMAGIQEICGRLGRITGMGVAANLAKCYSKTVVRGLVLLLCVANIFNLGADVAATAAATQLLVGGKLLLYTIFFGVASLLLQVYVPYRIYVRYLKWLTWALFAYVLTAFVVRVPWRQALRSTLVPSVSLDPKYLMALIAVLGTTISPYLFFWQTAQEVEDARINKHESPLRKKPLQAWAKLRSTREWGWHFRTSWHSLSFLPPRLLCTLQTRAFAFRQRPMRQRLYSLWLDALLRCCLRWESLGRECWRSRSWLARRRMRCRNCSVGGQAWRASRARRESFTTFFPAPPFLACA
jgi:hypothetical protein